MDKFVIKEYAQRFWMVAEVFKNDIEIATINKFYDVDKDWITIYEVQGGSGIGYEKGAIKQKIFIGNAEFKKEIINQ